MGNSFIVYIVMCSLFVLIIKADNTNGFCNKTISKIKRITQTYYVMRKTTTRTCFGPSWLRIYCIIRPYLRMRPYLQTRSIYTIGYEVEKRCCVGYTKNGTQCQKACDRGQYGKDCNKTCNCSNTPNTDGYCNQTTGKCICNPGWLGEYCSQSCPGQSCESFCHCSNNATCETTDGSCNCTVPGWTGVNCDEVCTNGTYGSGCSNQCECEEEGTESCDPVDGSCNCKPGKTGIMCEYECPFETYGYGCKNNCSCNNLQEYCRPSDGQCIKKCFCARDGTANCDNNHDDCKCKQQKRQKCISANFVQEIFDMYTDAIIDTCACKNGFDNICVPKNGTCICKHGYTGEWCNDVVSDSYTNTKSLIQDNNSVIIGPVIGSLIATVVIVIVVLLILRKTSCKKKVKKPTSMSDPVLSDSIAKNDQLYENANAHQTLEKVKLTKTDEKVKFTQAVKKANVAQINEKAKESQTYENLNAAETYEELNIAQVNENANVAQTYEKLNIAEIYEKLNKDIAEVNENANVAQTYEKLNIAEIYEKLNIDIAEVNENANVAQTYEKLNIVP